MATGTVLTLSLLATLAGCGRLGDMPTANAVSSGFRAAQVDAADLPLNKLPEEKLYVPSHPTRAPQPSTTTNGAKLYVGPAATTPAIMNLIRNAKKSVYLETFNFGDAYGDKLSALLIQKAKAGVDVKLEMDWLGSRFLKNHKAQVKAMRDAGIEVRIYRTRTIVKDDKIIGVNITHRKVYLADGEVALIGGVNMCAPFDTTTQDLLVEWRGPLVGQLYSEFARDWHAAGGTALQQVPAPDAKAGNIRAQIFVTSPREGRFESKEASYAAIDNARHEIIIQQQYLFDDGLIKRLHDAVARGVKLRMITPGLEAKGVFKNVHALEMKKLVEKGAQARLYLGTPHDAHLHTKLMVVDGNWAMTGSTNFDTRAFIENQEMAVVVNDVKFAGELQKRVFEEDWANHSEPFVYSDNWVSKPIRNLLELIDYYL
jgi:cardiolipin synthase